MRDEVPMGLVGDPGAERHLAQRAISVHVEDPQADGVDENIEDSAGLSALVMFKGNDRLVLGEGLDPSLQDFELCPFHVELDERRPIACRQGLVENVDLHLDLFESLNVVSTDVKAAPRIGPYDSSEAPRTRRARHSGLSDVYFRERFAEISGAVWKRLEGDVVPKRGIPNHVPQETASVGADVDAVGIGREGQRNEETQCLVVSHCAPGLTRPDHTLHHAQPCLHSYTPGDLQDLAANGDHDFGRIFDARLP